MFRSMLLSVVPAAGLAAAAFGGDGFSGAAVGAALHADGAISNAVTESGTEMTAAAAPGKSAKTFKKGQQSPHGHHGQQMGHGPHVHHKHVHHKHGHHKHGHHGYQPYWFGGGFGYGYPPPVYPGKYFPRPYPTHRCEPLPCPWGDGGPMQEPGDFEGDVLDPNGLPGDAVDPNDIPADEIGDEFDPGIPAGDEGDVLQPFGKSAKQQPFLKKPFGRKLPPVQPKAYPPFGYRTVRPYGVTR